MKMNVRWEKHWHEGQWRLRGPVNIIAWVYRVRTGYWNSNKTAIRYHPLIESTFGSHDSMERKMYLSLEEAKRAVERKLRLT